MKPMKFKIKDKEMNSDDNCLGYEEIIIIQKDLFKMVNRVAGDNEKEKYITNVNFIESPEYSYLAICDGELVDIHENDWAFSSFAYEFIGFGGLL